MNGLIRWVQKYEQSGMTFVANKVVLGMVRHFLTLAGGYFINQGVMSNNEQETAIAAVVTLIGVAWSVLVKMSAKESGGNSAAGTVIIVLLVCMFSSGCATTANDVAMAKIAADTASNYYQQPNSAEYMVMEGTNLEWSIRGATRITMSGPIPTKSIYPREEGTLKQVMDGASEITKTIALGAVGYQGVKALKAQKPTVVTTERLVPVTGAVP